MKQRNAAFFALLVTGAVVAARVGAAPISIDWSQVPAGQSVVGAGIVHPLLAIAKSGGNDVVAIHEIANPVAFGGTFIDANGNWWDIGNRGIGAGGFADVGSGTYAYTTKKHQYEFTFAASVRSFSLRMVDWSDFMPYGANASHTYSMDMTAYNAAGEVVDTDRIGFTVAGSDGGLSRNSVEFGPTRTAGDASLAVPGQPGNFTFLVAGSGITKVTLQPKDAPSTDPHMALSDLSFEAEDSDGDGVSDNEDHCPQSDLRAKVDTGSGATSVDNTVDDDGCSRQDLVKEAAAGARNRGAYVAAITRLANRLRAARAITGKQHGELVKGAARAK